MQYFPFYTDIEGKLCVIVGGGTVALRKAEKLLPFRPKIKVIAERVCAGLLDIPDIEIRLRKFLYSDINSAFMVIAATDDRVLNGEIYRLCSEKNIFVNTVDDKENCGFIFPALVKGENFTVAVSTSGKSPLYARYLREKIEKTIEDDSDEIIDLLSSCRELVKEKISGEEKRKAVFERILKQYIEDKSSIDIEKIIKEAEDGAL
ncbi:MAG: bifunctional precorrin-2 dehydrogenase/sirohydrochlorin ferrochelatase [Clostridia bacterium]|nr:bifunctional precorrin-2 dehydrogenase/sirohydrochlorin ferrochelatase [Clostridia bacterium]